MIIKPSGKQACRSLFINIEMLSSQPPFSYRWNQIGMKIKSSLPAESLKGQPGNLWQGQDFLPSFSLEEGSVQAESIERGLSSLLAPANTKNRRGHSLLGLRSTFLTPIHSMPGLWRPTHVQILGMVLSKKYIYFQKPNSYLKTSCKCLPMLPRELHFWGFK